MKRRNGARDTPSKHLHATGEESMSIGKALDGKVAVVTGATTGIGKEVARQLLQQGAIVVIGARSPERGEAARKELAEATGNQNVSVMPVDTSEISSVRAFAAAVQARHPKIHVLVNNAGG